MERNNREPSERQLAVHDCWDNTNLNILVEAVAGSGKTTLLLELLRKCKHRVLFLAFNKAIQTEIQEYIDLNQLSQGKSMTLHSLGLMALRKKYKKVKINNSKNFDIVKNVQKVNLALFKDMRWEDKLKISYTLMDMNDVSRIYLTTDVEEIKAHMLSMDKSFFLHDSMNSLWKDFLFIRDQYYNTDVVEIDFTDMIFLPVLTGLRIPIEPTYLFIDEAQDLNLAQHKLIDNLINQGHIEKWVAVGDRNQAIYGFSGAYASSFDIFKEKGNVLELPLDICYRCPIDIVNEANKVYDVMRGFKSYVGKIGEIQATENIKDSSMVVCRNSAPLIDLYFTLVSQKKKVYIKGDDILGKIKSFLKPYSSKRVGFLYEKTTKRLDKLADKTDDRSRFEFYYTQQNLFNLTSLINGGLTNYDGLVKDLIKNIDSIFANEGEGIVLCTIHKSKGLESDVVYILNENLIPSKYAKSEKQLRQEENLRYVARTRAKEELYYLNL